MSQATLLNSSDPMFAFEHAMQHRQYLAIIPNLPSLSAVPYLLDPPSRQDVPAGPWHLNHQQAHNDFNAVLPPFFAYNPADAPNLPFRIMQTNILVEGKDRGSDFSLREKKSSRENWTWWTFTNHQEHYIANNAILPLPSQAPMPPWSSQRPPTFPFW